MLPVFTKNIIFLHSQSSSTKIIRKTFLYSIVISFIWVVMIHMIETVFVSCRKGIKFTVKTSPIFSSIHILTHILS